MSSSSRGKTLMSLKQHNLSSVNIYAIHIKQLIKNLFDALNNYLKYLKNKIPLKPAKNSKKTTIKIKKYINEFSGYKRHSDGRLSQALHDFVNMGSRERDLMEQNNRLENVLEYAHKELRDLEVSNKHINPPPTPPNCWCLPYGMKNPAKQQTREYAGVCS